MSQENENLQFARVTMIVGCSAMPDMVYQSIYCFIVTPIPEPVRENDNIVRVYISRLFNIFHFGQKYFSGKDTYYDLKYTRPPRSAPENFHIGAHLPPIEIRPPRALQKPYHFAEHQYEKNLERIWEVWCISDHNMSLVQKSIFYQNEKY